MTTRSRPDVAVLIALGANLGDRMGTLRRAIRRLAPTVEVDAVSTVYETAPMYVEDQGRFLNAALVGRTGLGPHALLDALKEIEAALGRVPTARHGPRAIDLDILFYGDRTISDDRLTVPHPAMAERSFVLVPAAEIAPDWPHPVTGETVSDMLRHLDPVSGILPVAAPEELAEDAA